MKNYVALGLIAAYSGMLVAGSPAFADHDERRAIKDSEKAQERADKSAVQQSKATRDALEGDANGAERHADRAAHEARKGRPRSIESD